jgi:hypothetical protein
MPIFPKRRFQHGAVRREVFRDLFPEQPTAYRRVFHAIYE